MINPKFKFTEETITVSGKTLYRIQAVKDFGFLIKKNDIGGFIEKEDNLSHQGSAWVFGDARVYGDAQVYGNAHVFGNAQIYGSAFVFGAYVYENARVFGDARVYGDGNARICGNAQVFEDVWVFGDACFGDAQVEKIIKPLKLILEL